MDAQGQSIDIDTLPFEQQISILMEDLPAPLQKFLRGPERDAISLSLTQKYQLHADQGAAFEHAYLYLLLGVNTPDEFVQDLRAAGIEEEKIRGLATDVNEQVFKKLQQEERGAPAVTPAPAIPATMPQAEKDSPASALQSTAYPREQLAEAYQRASLSVRTSLTNPDLAAIVRTIRTGHRLPSPIGNEFGSKVGFLLLGLMSTNEFKNQMILAGAAPDAAQNTIDEVQRKILDLFKEAPPQPVAPPPVPMPAPAPMPSSAPTAGFAPMPVSAPAATAPIARTMAKDMQEMLHPEQRQAAVHPAQASPARSFQTASVPSTVPPVVPVPPPQPAAPAYTPPPAPQAPAPHSTWQPAPASSAPSGPTAVPPRQYGVDPYREIPE